MHPKLASIVHPVFERGLDLAERLDQGETVNLQTEQAILRDLLLVEAPSGLSSSLDGSAWRMGPAGLRDARRGDEPAAREPFLGVRYALTCWLDELFTCQSSWGDAWNEQKLEVELYGTNNRAWRFWQQAEIAQSFPGTDAFEVFFLCVMLGFRGEMRERPDRLAVWLDSARHRVGKIEDKEWVYATELPAVSRVPPLRGRKRLAHMVLAAWGVALSLIPAIAFVLVHKLGR